MRWGEALGASASGVVRLNEPFWWYSRRERYRSSIHLKASGFSGHPERVGTLDTHHLLTQGDAGADEYSPTKRGMESLSLFTGLVLLDRQRGIRRRTTALKRKVTVL